jgi:plasmid stabilization system protein ParE
MHLVLIGRERGVEPRPLLDQAAAQLLAPLARLRRHGNFSGLPGQLRQLQDGDAVAVLRRQLVVVDRAEQEARPGDELLGGLLARPAQRRRPE